MEIGGGVQALQLGSVRGPSAAAKTDLGNCAIRKLPLGKIPLGSCRLGKELWESLYHLHSGGRGNYLVDGE